MTANNKNLVDNLNWDCQVAGKCFFITLLDMCREYPELSLEEALQKMAVEERELEGRREIK